MKQPLLSIIIPVYNERNTLEKLVNKVDLVKLDKQIIIVDDGSTDGSKEIIANLKTKSPLVKKYHRQNRGKGSAIRTGLKLATGQYTVVQDADLEYYPNDLKKLLTPLEVGESKVVYGSRFKYAEKGIYSSFWFYIGGQSINWLTNFLYGLEITDEPTCYKVLDTQLLKSLKLKAKGFEFCPEVTAKLALRGERIVELPIKYKPRHFDEGKKIGWQDGIIAIKTLLKYRFQNQKNKMTSGLQMVSLAKNYNHWIFNQFKKYIKGNVLEVGGGIGTFTEALVDKADKVTTLEIDKQYLQQLKDKFKNNKKIKVASLNLSRKTDNQKLRGKFDLIIMINVLEHIKDHQQMLANLHSKLKPDGKLFIFVPAHQELYSNWDSSVGHFRRYSKHQLSSLAQQAGFKVKRSTYFNSIGAIGWAMNKWLKSKPGDKGLVVQTLLFDRLIVPIISRLEAIAKPLFGQSLILVAQK